MHGGTRDLILRLEILIWSKSRAYTGYKVIEPRFLLLGLRIEKF